MSTVSAPPPEKSTLQKQSDKESKPGRYDLNDIKAAARGQWPAILNRVAGIGDDYLSGNHGPCPKCGGDNRWRFTNLNENGGAICNQCGKFGDGLAVIERYAGMTFREALEVVASYLGLSPQGSTYTENSRHTPKFERTEKFNKPTEKPKPEPFGPDETDAILRRFNELLGLSDSHRQKLQERGLSNETIDEVGYASLGTKEQTISEARLFAEQPPGNKWFQRVPGFRGCAAPRLPGIIIPVRDRLGRHIASQVRVNDPNAESKYIWQTGTVSPGSPVHHTAGCEADECDCLGITEGPLKAELARQFTGFPFLAIAGVGLWERLCDAITAIKPNQVLVALDNDYRENAAVGTALKELVAWLRASEIPFAIARWPAIYKGIDDAVAAGIAVERIADTEGVDAILGQCAETGATSTSVKEKQKTEIVVPFNDPQRLGEENLSFYRSTKRDIRYWRGQWWTYKGKCWEPRTETYMRARFRGFIEERFRQECEEQTEWFERGIEKGELDEEKAKRPKKMAVSGSTVRNTAEAIQAMCVLPDHVEMERFLPERQRRPIVAVSNGLLDLDQIVSDPSKALLPHSPNWFSSHCHEYRFDITAECPNWLRFLNSVFLNRENKVVDSESIDTLQRWFGYCLMLNVRLQKMLILDGVSRSGKGVIARILKRLVGESFVASPKLRDFAGDFGLQPLLSKRLAVIGDAKLDRYRHDTESILETLLGVIGEDSMDVNVKRMDASTSRKLDVKFMLLCNGIPSLNDPAQAIVNRVVVLKFNNSFVGQEDTELTETLLREMDGIFLWSLLGYEKMVGDFRLPQPASGQDSLDNFRRAVSPIRGFVDECCFLRDMDAAEQPAFMTDRDDAYAAWIGYCRSAGREHPGTRANFVRQLTNAYPHIIERRPGHEHRRYILVNIELNSVGRENVTVGREKRDGAGQSDSGGHDDDK